VLSMIGIGEATGGDWSRRQKMARSTRCKRMWLLSRFDEERHAETLMYLRVVCV
jgi:hypothetical protein